MTECMYNEQNRSALMLNQCDVIIIEYNQSLALTMRNDLDILYKVKLYELTTKSSLFCQNYIALGKRRHATASAGKPNRIQSVKQSEVKMHC